MHKVMYFSTTTCGPCKSLKPIVQEVANELGANVEYIDASTSPLTETFNVRAVPTLIVIKNGIPATRHTGLASKEQIKSLFI
jgi:thioredoxin 1